MLGPKTAIGLAVVLFLAPWASAQGPFVEIPGAKEFTGQILATPKALAARDDVEKAITGFQLKEHAPGPDRYVLVLPDGVSEEEAADALMDTGLFEFVTPDWMVFPIGCPDDPLLGNQWHHDANRMNSCNGWDIHTGKFEVTVAICDTGIRRTHNDLRDNRREGYNAPDREWERAGGRVDDINGHGTNCTGCAAANGNNGLGISGVGWNLRHRMMRVTNDSGGGAFMSNLLHAAETAIENGDRVASVSYSGVDDPGVRSTATYIKSINGLLVWAAGNESRNLDWGDRDNDDVIVVGATDSGDNLSWFSNFGRSVDLVAPGSSVYTTSNSGDDSYGSVSGTSFSCPLTAGLCGLIFSANPGMSPDQCETKLKNGCDDLGASGEDNTFGHGRIDVYESLTRVNTVHDDMIMQVTLKGNGSINGVSFTKNDIVRYYHATRAVEMVVDMSDLFSPASNLDGFTVLDDGTYLMSFADTESVPGVGTVEDEDLVQFTPTSLGPNTAGTFSFYFDGSDVDLNANSEDIGGVSTDDQGNLYLTTKGQFSVTGVSGKNEDIIRFSPTSLGSNTSGTWSMFFDGTDSDAKMGKSKEKVDAVDYCWAMHELFLSTAGNHKVPYQISGDSSDLLGFDIKTSGSNTTGFMIASFDDDANGFGSADIDGMDIED